MAKPIPNASIYPRPFDTPRLEPEGRCCTAIEEAERAGVAFFDRARGGFTIVDPRAIIVTIRGEAVTRTRIMISFCPFCGFPWNEIAPQVVVLEASAQPMIKIPPRPRRPSEGAS